ncbi:hypothetical protein PSE_p0044 (plasmid) [Pseudovibrio sp. FO-BEG1]|nr:hypothetical protein PSE_p0044 [Pseudovibrio sp. FO-BEG1]
MARFASGNIATQENAKAFKGTHKTTQTLTDLGATNFHIRYII